MLKAYECICGQVFDDPQKFNSHKQNCKIHIVNKYGSWEVYNDLRTRGHELVAQKVKNTTCNKRLIKLQCWISEKHTCEKCGKIMTEKYGSGRFCSRQCANSHVHTEESKRKTSKTIRNTITKKLVQETRSIEPRYCSICGSILPIKLKNRKTCSDTCKKESFRLNAITNGLGGPSKVSSYGKRGTYKGIHCDSTYELALLIYCLDHKIDIQRNETKFPYVIDDKKYSYYPDFYLPEYDIFIETKGRDIGPVYEKAQAVIDAGKKLKILHYEDLKECFNYITQQYNVRCSLSNNTIYTLYDDYMKS